jgi:hypothetical protein
MLRIIRQDFAQPLIALASISEKRDRDRHRCRDARAAAATRKSAAADISASRAARPAACALFDSRCRPGVSSRGRLPRQSEAQRVDGPHLQARGVYR